MESSADPGAPEPASVESPSPTSTTGADSGVQLRTGSFLLITLVAGGVFFGIGMMVFPVFQAPTELFAPMPPPEIAIAREKALVHARLLNTPLLTGILAFLMVASLGAGEATARRLQRGTLGRLALAVVVGTAVGCVSGLLGHFITEALVSAKALTPMGRTLVVQTVMLAVFGAGVGCAVGLVAGGRHVLSCTVATAVSGILAGLIFPVACAILMHRARTEVVIPGGVLKAPKEPFVFALWLGLLVLAIGLIVPAIQPRRTGATPAKEAGDPSTS